MAAELADGAGPGAARNEPEPPDLHPSATLPERPFWTDRVAIALVSGGAIAMQIALTRVFSITLWHHFAYLVVGLALLGFGIAGSWLSTRAQPPGPGPALRAMLARRATAAGALGLLSVLAALTIRCNPLELLHSGSVVLSLGLIVLLATIPFLGAGLVIGTALGGWSGRAGTVYAADLIGGGAAGALGALALPHLGALGLIGTCCATTAAAAILFAPTARARLLAAASALAVLLAAVGLLRDEDDWIVPAPTKEISLYHRPEVGVRVVERRAWSVHGRIDVGREVTSPPFVAGEVLVHAGRWRSHPLTQDGAAPTAIHAVDSDPAELLFLARSSTSAIWALRGASLKPRREQAPDGPNVLVIGVGGGIDVMNALAHGARKVTGAEINPAIVSLLTGPYRAFSGNLAGRDDVRLVQSEGRSFVRSTTERYDVIQLAGVDTFTALSSGAYSLAEAYVYTVEAFEDYLDHLTDDGCFSISRLILEPPRETLRLAVTAHDALRVRGVEAPARHIAVLRARRWATLLACTKPLEPAAVDRLRAFARDNQFALSFDPLQPGDDAFGRALTGPEQQRRQFVRAYPYRLEPATDESPFFFNYYRWKNLAAMPRLRSTEMIYGTTVPIGHAVLLVTMFFTGIAAAVGILRPLRKTAALRTEPGHRHVALYFAALGVAYLLVEVGLLQRLTFLLGHPTHALTVVLSALLVSSGIGAALSRRLASSGVSRALPWALVSVLVLLAVASHALLPALVGQPFAVRLAMALALVVPCGVLMGVPFPTGLELVRVREARLVPWAFGVNAFFTVLASAVAPLIALDTGFSWLFLLAAIAYAIAFFVLPRFPRPSAPPPAGQPRPA